MRIGKAKASVWERSVRRQLHKNPYGSPLYGEDAGIIRPCRTSRKPVDPSADDPESRMAVHSVQGGILMGQRLLSGLCAKLLAAGVLPRSASCSVVFPDGTEEEALKQLTRTLAQTGKEYGVAIRGFEVHVLPSVSEPLFWGSAVGSQCLKKETGDNGPLELVVAGPVGLEGTALIAVKKEEELKSRYPDFFIREAAGLYQEYMNRHFLGAIRRIWEECPPARMYSLGEGGVFSGIWELAAAAGVGLDLDLLSIPIRQHTVELCEFFDLNPYMLFSGGSVLILCQDGDKIAQLLREEGIPGAVIGRTDSKKARLIHYDGETRYLEPPKQDEYYKIT